ncbi:MAG: hypothetical protein ACJA1E_001972 [Paracoccaceae bacterium]
MFDAGSMDLSRFDAAPLIAFTATKEIENGNAKVNHGSGEIVLLRAE